MVDPQYAAAAKQQRSKTILVVDDEPVVRQVVHDYLLLRRYNVLTAADGQAALALLASTPQLPHLILLDVMMPGLDGFEVLARLKRDDRTKKIPVIMLTARGETSAIFQSQDLRATDYVIKPVDLEELVEVIQRHVF